MYIESTAIDGTQARPLPSALSTVKVDHASFSFGMTRPHTGTFSTSANPAGSFISQRHQPADREVWPGSATNAGYSQPSTGLWRGHGAPFPIAGREAWPPMDRRYNPDVSKAMIRNTGGNDVSMSGISEQLLLHARSPTRQSEQFLLPAERERRAQAESQSSERLSLENC